MSQASMHTSVRAPSGADCGNYNIVGWQGPAKYRLAYPRGRIFFDRIIRTFSACCKSTNRVRKRRNFAKLLALCEF